MIRMHDVNVVREDDRGTDILEGTFRVVLTPSYRVAVEIIVTESALGPLRLLFAVDHGRALALPATYRTAGIFDAFSNAVSSLGHTLEHAAKDVGHGLEHGAEAAFNATSKVATTLARPAFNVARDAAAGAVNLVAHAPFVPESERKKIEAASRTILRARLGDVTAKDFIRTVAEGAKAGVHAFREAGDALLTGTKVVAHVLDAPMALAEHIPVVGGFIHSTSPFHKIDTMADALQKGDFDRIKNMVADDARMTASVASLIPGLGTAISSAISTGLAILDGGGPLEIAISAAYGAIPIPPGLRTVTDVVLASVMSLAKQHSLTDVAVNAARKAVPEGLPRDIFDTLIQLVVKRVPLTRAGGDLVTKYVQRYAPDIPGVREVTSAAERVANVAKNAAGPAMRFVDAAGRPQAAAQHTAASFAHALDIVPPRFQLPAAH